MKKIFIFIAAFIIYLTTSTSIFAISFQVTPLDESNNPISKLDENAPRAKITASSLLPNTDYQLCIGWARGLFGVQGGCNDELLFIIHPNEIINGTYSKIVCGGKVGGGASGDDFPALKSDNCNSGDFFHAHNYDFEMHRVGESGEHSGQVQIDRFYPNIQFSTMSPQANQPFNITISGNRRPFGSAERNEYEARVENTRIGDVFQIPNGGSKTVELGPYSEGTYTLEVKIPNRDIDGTWDDKWNAVNGLVARYTITITSTGGSISGGSGSNGPHGDGGYCNNDENMCNPCTASGCETALGTIPTSLKGFAERLLTIATGIAGGIALILMVIGSVRILSSSGDPKAVSGGREMIVAAVAGLLFLTFAVLILRFIGINVLGLNT